MQEKDIDKKTLVERFKQFISGEEKEKKKTSIAFSDSKKFKKRCTACKHWITHDGEHDIVCENCGYLNLASNDSNHVITFFHYGYDEYGNLGVKHNGKPENCPRCNKNRNR